MDSASSATSSNAPPPTRAQRGPIASQACDTCRQRKQKCDEQRPRCGLCQRMKLECRYREPQPTKKDKTMVEILDYVKSIHTDIEQMKRAREGTNTGFGPPQQAPSSQTSFVGEATESRPYGSSMDRSHPRHSVSVNEGNRPYKHASAAHKMLTWPAISQLLLQAVPSIVGDLNSLRDEGSAFIVRMQKGTPNLPLDEGLPDAPFIGMQTQESRTAGGVRSTYPSLTRDTMLQLATAYFDTFNVIYPFMDRQTFISDTMPKVQSEGFDGDTESVIALLVFALGELAMEGSRGNPINLHGKRASGVKGGTAKRPPGLALFNEARKRIGFVLTQCDLENVQVYSLLALYYECCSRHVEFWRMTVSASHACQVIISCNTIDWDSPKGDLIKRAYWHCVLMETFLHLELDLPLTGLISLESHIGMPSFNQPFCEADDRANKSSHFETHYASLVALRGVCATLHSNINESMKSSSDTATSSIDSIGSPSPTVLKQLASKLEQWRENLPAHLQWAEVAPASFPIPQAKDTDFSQDIDPELSPDETLPPLMFSEDLDKEPAHYPYLYDIQVALLRTRYYYAKYTIYRPFVYKALHSPDQMTQEDAEGVAECLRSCLKWPLTMSPTSRRKRLIPYLFCWSQNFLGILLIFHMARHNEMLQKICERLCGPTFWDDANASINLMRDWIRDLKSSDPIAMWCWKILQGVGYPVEE